MITLQHVALFKMACFEMDSKSFTAGLPWMLLPDAIRAYTKKRQISHFEQTPDKDDCSWIEFPDPQILPLLNGDNALKYINYRFPAEKYPACAVGEKTKIKVFDAHNYWHPFYKFLRIHLAQDMVFDRFVRSEIMDMSWRFNDQYFVKTSKKHVTGAEIREIIANIEMAGFLHLAGKVFEKTGILIDQEWFNREVYAVLENSVYPDDLAATTIKYMKIPDKIDEMIKAHSFSAYENLPGMTEEVFESIVDKMYAQAFNATRHEL
jgi:hypothetical protein